MYKTKQTKKYTNKFMVLCLVIQCVGNAEITCFEQFPLFPTMVFKHFDDNV